MADNETIADIIAEMRGMGNYQRYSGDHARVLAGRLDAAHKREAAFHAMTCEANDRLREHLRIALDSSKRERGDAAKLREACANIAEYARSAQCHTEDAHVLGYLNQIEGWANAALAAPARNCDVGTPDEQVERWNNGNPYPCKWDDKQYFDARAMLEWAQMPYEEGGAK